MLCGIYKWTNWYGFCESIFVSLFGEWEQMKILCQQNYEPPSALPPSKLPFDYSIRTVANIAKLKNITFTHIYDGAYNTKRHCIRTIRHHNHYHPSPSPPPPHNRSGEKVFLSSHCFQWKCVVLKYQMVSNNYILYFYRTRKMETYFISF